MRLVIAQGGFGAGGAEKAASLLARHRAERGDDVRVLGFAAPDGDSYFPYPPSVALESWRPASARRDGLRLSGAREQVQRLLWLRRRLRELRPDAVVSLLTKVNVLTLIAARGLHVPVIVSERNNPGMQQAARVWSLAWTALSPLAAGIVMQTERALESLPRGARPLAVVIPNPCALPLGARPSERPQDGAQRIVAVGRLERQKGFDLLIDAFARVARRDPGPTLTVFGEGAERPRLEAQIAALALGDRVRLPGLTRDAAGWIAEADLFVLSSRFEGFPNVLVEALAAGIPSLAFDCPWGPSDILVDGESGLLAPAGSVPALAEGMERLLADPDLRARLSAGGRAAATRFSLADVLSRWDEVIARTEAEPQGLRGGTWSTPLP